MLFVLALAAASPDVAASSPATLPPKTGQQLFERATVAFEKGDDARALADYTLVEQRITNKSPRVTLAVVRVRKGISLARLGRREEAEAVLRSGLAAYPDATDPTGDRAAALLMLGRMMERDLDYAAARREYESALALIPLGPLNARMEALAGIGRVAMFDDSARALQAADQAAALLTPQSEKALIASVRTLRGRILMNRGDYAVALKELKQATAELGGLTAKVNIADIHARSDVAIAALLAKQPDEARKYLAWTGAGHTDAPLPGVVDMELPMCGDADDIRPNDVAIVQFAISDDGGVERVFPVYASRPGPIALAFARSVAKWSWTPDEITKIKPFFRSFIRLQLRCSSVAQRPSVLAQLEFPLKAWLTRERIDPYQESEGSAARRLAAAHAETERRRVTDKNSAQVLPVLLAVAKNPLAPSDDRLLSLQQARIILTEKSAPAAVQAYVQILLADATLTNRAQYGRSIGRATAGNLRSLTRDEQIMSDPIAAAAVRLSLADVLAYGGSNDEQIGHLSAVADDARLSKTDPLRVGALVRLASVYARRGDLPAARAAYQQTKLSDQQCALLDVKPRLTRSGVSSAEFPSEALQWGFEGWTRQEFDVAGDGRPLNVRTVIAYPPFVFGEASERMIARSRFEQSFRPAGGLGCTANTQGLRFQIP